MQLHNWFRRYWVSLLAAIMLPLLGSCGYQFVGESSLLLKDARTIYVEPFVNRSRDIGTEKELTTALRGEFYRRGQLKVVDNSEQADLLLTGVVRSLDSTVATVNQENEVLQYESALTLDVTLRRREPNEILWRGQNVRLTQIADGSRAAVVTTSSSFQSGTLNTSDVRRMTDIQSTAIERQAAREDLMEQFAKELHQRVMEMF